MKQLISAILCLAAVPAWAADNPKELVDPVQNAEAPKAERKHSGFRRTKFTYVAPRENWGSVAGWFTGGITRPTFRSRRAAREERLFRQQERLAKGYGNPFAPKVDATPISRLAALPLPVTEAPSVVMASKPAPREAQPGEFRPRIYGLD